MSARSTLCTKSLSIRRAKIVFVFKDYLGLGCKHFEIGGDKKGKGTSLF